MLAVPPPRNPGSEDTRPGGGCGNEPERAAKRNAMAAWTSIPPPSGSTTARSSGESSSSRPIGFLPLVLDHAGLKGLECPFRIRDQRRPEGGEAAPVDEM